MPPDLKSWLSGKDLDAGKEWRQKEGMAEDGIVSTTDSMDMDLSKLQEIVEDGNLACGSPWGHKELDIT